MQERNGVRSHWGVRIPMRDGIQLHATLYLPTPLPAPSPVIFTLTPYIAQTYHPFALEFAAHGLPFLAIDVRGRGNSEGDFHPLHQEAKDGYDVTEWIARQSYCNGKVTMWGGSYAGYAQWAAAKEFPPHLGTIVPVASPYIGLDFPLSKNITGPYLMQWLTLVAGRTSQDKVFWDNQSYWNEQFLRFFEDGLRFNSLDMHIGMPSDIFQEWLQHPQPDDYWDEYNPTSAQYAELSLPILSLCGIYDGNQAGTLKHYTEHMKHASEDARARHYLVIGPWDHAGTRVPRAEVGGLTLGSQSLVDLPKLHRQWYVWTMQGGPRPDFLQRNVAYYVMGAERWRYTVSLEAITAQSQPYFISSPGPAGDVFHSGSLNIEPPAATAPSQYIYDPRDTSAAKLESLQSPGDLTDQRLILRAGATALIFHSAPFERNTEVSGFFRLSAWFAIDQPDTDFSVAVYEIGTDGSSVLLTADWMRARYRESLSKAKLICTREPLRYDFEHFWFVSREIRKGHRLRLVIGPMNSIHRQKNYNTGGIVAKESMRDARTVHVSLFHDHTHPSALYVPLAHPVSPDEPHAPPSALISSVPVGPVCA